MHFHAGLNLGCGQHADIATQDWLNVDRHCLPEWPQPPDVLANVLEGLPFPTGRFSYVYLGHLLEHLEYTQELPAALAEVRRVCRPQAQIRVVGPCLHRAAKLHFDPEWVALWDHGVDDASGLCHRWAPTTEATLAAVQLLDPDAYEIPVETVRLPEWPNADHQLYQCAFAATLN